MKPESHDLIQRYMAGLLTEDEATLLQTRLKADAELRKLYLHYMNLDVALEAQSAAAEGTRELLTLHAQPAAKATRWWSWPRLAAAAVIALLGVLSIWGTWSRSNAEVWVYVAAGEKLPGALPVGASAQLRHLTLSEGRVSLRMKNGIELSLLAPAQVEFVSDMHLKLVHGRVTADVGERGKGFVIETSQMRIVDLGTRFGVDASDAAQTDVVVFSGQVEVYESARQSGPLIAALAEGEGVRVAQKQNSQRIKCVFTGQRSDDWTTQAAGSVIADVRDNQMSAEDGKRFYRVAVKGMEAGAEARHTRGRKWFPVGADTLPGWLAGADVVETFASDANNTAFEVTLTLAQPAVLYVIHDLQQAPPAWLQSRFTDSGLRLRLERDSPDDHPTTNRPFAVWKSAALPAGTITLGPQREEGQPKVGKMYGVAAKALQ